MRRWVTRLCCLAFLCLLFANLAVCLADSPNPALFRYDVDIEGAKVISEGGYLWFHIVNQEAGIIQLGITYPSDMTTPVNPPENTTLQTNETVDYYFQVPYYWSGVPLNRQPENSSLQLTFIFSLYGPQHDPPIGIKNVEFDVKVLELNPKTEDQVPLYVITIIIVALVIAAIFSIPRYADKRKLQSLWHRIKPARA